MFKLPIYTLRRQRSGSTVPLKKCIIHIHELVDISIRDSNTDILHSILRTRNFLSPINRLDHKSQHTEQRRESEEEEKKRK